MIGVKGILLAIYGGMGGGIVLDALSVFPSRREFQMAQQGRIRLLVADDHEVVRNGLKSLLQGTEIKVVAEVATGQAAVKYALEHQVDVVLLDVQMPDGDGLIALGRIKLDKPDLPILMLSTFDNPAYAARAFALGASGYLVKGCTRDELLGAIKTAVAGENVWTPGELLGVSGALSEPRITANVEVSLTEHERDILRQVANGLTNEQIAQALDLSYDTIKERIQRILSKIGVVDRTQAAVWAVRKGLV
jgi:DNA-binding NarL/FixJ family response regulator